MTCNIDIATPGETFQIIKWASFTFLFYVIGTFMFWRPRWYTFLHAKTSVAPPQNFFFLVLAGLALANTYASWRIWLCHDWNTTNGAITLGVYVFMIIAEALVIPFIMYPNLAIVGIVMALIHTALSITFTVLCFVLINDIWPALIGIANIIAGLFFLILTFQMWSMENLNSEYETEKPLITPKAEKLGSGIHRAQGHNGLRHRPLPGSDTATHAEQGIIFN